MPTTVAVIQRPPVLLDRNKTIEQAVSSIGEAASASMTHAARDADPRAAGFMGMSSAFLGSVVASFGSSSYIDEETFRWTDGIKRRGGLRRPSTAAEATPYVVRRVSKYRKTSQSETTTLPP